MIEQEYIMLIMNCKKYLKKAEFQKRTWLPNIPSYLKYYHVLGDESLEENYKFDNENNILLVKVADDYNSLPKKVIAAYNAVFETFNFKYIYKTDDDQILVRDNFLGILRELISRTPRIHYGGHIIITENYLSQYHRIHPELPANLPIFKTKYCSGRFYFLSDKAVEYLISKRHLIEKEYLEDYAIGYYLEPEFKINMLGMTTNRFFKDIEQVQEEKI